MEIKLNKNNFEPNWNFYSFALIFLAFLFQIAKWQLLPMFIDIYYHLSVMLGFDKAGGYVASDFWEYAPIGRPHLYPPLLHILMLIFYKLGFSKLFIARFFSFIMYPVLLVVIWHFCKSFFNKRVAFFSVLLCSSSHYFYLEISNTIAFSLALILGLLAIIALKKKMNIASSILLGLCFYAHGIMGWIILISIILYGIFTRKMFINLKVVLSAIIMYLPLFIYQLSNRGFFQFVDLKAMQYIEIGVLVYLFSIFGIFVCLKKKKNYYILIAFLLSFSLLISNYRQRYFSGHGAIGFIFLAAIALESSYLWIKSRFPKANMIFISIVFVSFYLVYPTLSVGKNQKLTKMNSYFVNIIPKLKPYGRGSEYSIYIPKYINPIANIIKRNLREDEIFYSDLSYAAGMLSVFSNRATSSAMLPEIKPYKDFDLIKESKLIVWFKQENFSFPTELKEAIAKYGLTYIGQTPLVYIYKNSLANSKVSPSRPLLSNWLIFSILFVCIMLVLWDIYKNRVMKEKT